MAVALEEALVEAFTRRRLLKFSTKPFASLARRDVVPLSRVILLPFNDRIRRQFYSVAHLDCCPDIAEGGRSHA